MDLETAGVESQTVSYHRSATFVLSLIAGPLYTYFPCWPH